MALLVLSHVSYSTLSLHKMFGFRLATVFLLGYRLSQQKTTRYSETLAVYSYAPVNAQYAISRDFS